MELDRLIMVLSDVVEHRHEYAAEAECAIHVFRRIERSMVHHKTTLDGVLCAAEKFLAAEADVNRPPYRELGTAPSGTSAVPRTSSSSVD